MQEWHGFLCGMNNSGIIELGVIFRSYQLKGHRVSGRFQVTKMSLVKVWVNKEGMGASSLWCSKDVYE